MNTNVNKIMANTLIKINTAIEQLSDVSEQRIKEINRITEDYKNEFIEYKEKNERKTKYWERRNNIKDWLLYIAVFSMPVYVLIEIYFKFFAK